MKKFILLLVYMHAGAVPQAVTYELSPGRFGDNLLSYIHAKWISYRHHIPLLYKPFVYSESLVMHTDEQLYTEGIRRSYSNYVIWQNQEILENDISSTLYLVPYFPESKYERATGISFSGGRWSYFAVDWNDEGFIQELRRVIAPTCAIKSVSLPSDRISVAVHVRRGGDHDTPVTLVGFPLKFLADEFYIGWIDWLYDFLGKKPMYVHVFTDDHDPEKLVDRFRSCLQYCDISWGFREKDNSEIANVLDDFFAMGQFDCLIHSESNFSFIMSKLNNYLVSLYPDSYLKKGGYIFYDHVNISINQKRKELL